MIGLFVTDFESIDDFNEVFCYCNCQLTAVVKQALPTFNPDNRYNVLLNIEDTNSHSFTIEEYTPTGELIVEHLIPLLSIALGHATHVSQKKSDVC